MRILLFIFNFLIAQNFLFAQQYLNQASKIKAKADSFFVIGKLDEASKLYKEELSIYQKNKDLHRIAIGKSNVSAIHLYKSELDDAIRLCSEALKILPSKTETDTTRFRLYRFLGMYYFFQKKIDSSDFYYEKAEVLIEKSKTVANCSDIISFYNDLGAIASSSVDLKRAEIMFQKAEKSLYLDPLYNKSAIYNNQGRIYYLQRNFEMALKYYIKAEQNTRESNTLAYVLKEQANCLISMGEFSEAQSKIIKADKSYRQFLVENKTQPDLIFESTYYFSLAWLNSKQKNYSLAETNFKKAIAIDSKTGNKSLIIAESYRNIADNLTEQELFVKALDVYQQALKSIHFDFSPKNIYQLSQTSKVVSEREYFRILVGKAKTLSYLAELENKIQNLKSSLETYQKAIEVADKMRRSYGSANAKSFFTETYFDVYQHSIEVANLLFQNTQNKTYISIAYDIYEKSRATILNDVLRETDIKFNTVDTQLRIQETRLNKEILAKQMSLSKLKDSTKIKEIYEQLTELELSKLNLNKRIEKGFPNYYQLKYAINKTDIAFLQKNILDKNSVLISYLITQDNLYIYLLSDLELKIIKQTKESELERKLNQFRNLLANSPQGKKYNAQALSAELYDVLIKPIEKEIEGKKRLIIIRDAELNYLPFEVLAKQKDDFLLKKYIISYAYSASLLLPTEQQRKQSSGLLGFAPFSNNSFQQSLFRDKNLGQLPKSGSEVGKIGGDIYLENEATKKLFYEKYRDKNIIHFATHAITDDSDPLKSFIAFYPDNTDYKLFTNELYDLDLRNTSLVMLSACETGAGKFQKGEGVMSLSRAFTYAGAKAVITTLWNAHDEASAYISERFYKHLKGGLKTDEALRQAKLDFLNSDLALRYEHPYYWANFILIGPAETIDFGTDWWIRVVSVLLLVVIIYFFRRKVTKK